MKNFFTAVIVVVTAFNFCCCKNSDCADNSLTDLKARGELVLGYENYPPFAFLSENNVVEGFDIDLAKEVCKRLEVDLKLQNIEWNKKHKELKKGSIDCIWNAFTVTEDRMKTYCLTTPYFVDAITIAVGRNSPVENLCGFEGKKLSVVEDSSGQKILEENRELLQIFSGTEKEISEFMVLHKLELREADAGLVDRAQALYYNRRYGLGIKVLDDNLQEYKYSVAFRKEDKSLRDEVQRILIELKDDGTMEHLAYKWFGSDSVIKMIE